jgi:cytochrome c oxidase cbb3-type subunit 3
MRGVRVFALVFVAGTLMAQHGYTPGDIEEGERLFIENCAICHGPEGDAVPKVDLAHGKFRRASTDEDLMQIIKNGIPGTAMPGGNYHEHQLTTFVAYLRNMAASIAPGDSSPGDAVRGKTIFEGKGGCLNCHRVKGQGSYLGPELTDIGITRRTAQLERSLTDPDAEILPQNRFFRVVTQDGTTITGRLLNQDAFTIQLMDISERLRSFLKVNLREFAFIDKSPMPSYSEKLSAGELADVVSYLVTLKGIDKRQ